MYLLNFFFFNQEFKITQARKMVKNKGVGKNNQFSDNLSIFNAALKMGKLPRCNKASFKKLHWFWLCLDCYSLLKAMITTNFWHYPFVSETPSCLKYTFSLMYLKHATVRECHSLIKVNTCKPNCFLISLSPHPKANTTIKSSLSYRSVNITNKEEEHTEEKKVIVWIQFSTAKHTSILYSSPSVLIRTVKSSSPICATTLELCSPLT